MGKGNISTIAFGGTMTPEQTLLEAMGKNQAHGFQRVLVVAVDSDGDVHLSHSTGNGLEYAGLLEVAKDAVVSSMAFRSMSKNREQ